MHSKIHITSPTLKDMLALFDPAAELNEIMLGDTWHPAAGFVDEKILNGRNTIAELLEFDYDFKGLVEFEANVESMRIRLIKSLDGKNSEYQITGEAHDINTLKNKVIEANAYHPNKYEFSATINW